MKKRIERLVSVCRASAGIAMLTLIAASTLGCQPAEPIKIGVVGTFSGPSSDLSVSGRRGAEMAAEGINAEGGIDGRRIHLVFKDDENSPEGALEQQKAYQAEGVKLIIGHSTSQLVLAVIDYVNSKEALLLGPTISGDLLSGKDDHFIRFMASTKEQARVLSDTAASRNHESILVLYDEKNLGYTGQLVANYEQLIKEKLGRAPILHPFDPANDISTDAAIDKVRQLSPEALLLVISAEDSAKFAYEVRSMAKRPQLYGSLWSNTPELIRKGGKSVNGMLLVGGHDEASESPAYKAFHETYFKTYGEAPTFASLYTYEALMATARAIDEANSTEPEAVKAKMIEIKNFEGLQSQFSIDAYGDNTREYLIFEVHEGNVRKVEE